MVCVYCNEQWAKTKGRKLMLVSGINRPHGGLQPQVCGKVHNEVYALVHCTLLPVDEMSSGAQATVVDNQSHQIW